MKAKPLVFVTAMPRASVTEDGSYAEMELTYSNGTSQYLRFQPETFQGLLSRVNELVVNQQMRKAQAQGHLLVQPTRVVSTMAQEAVGGKAVVLMMKLHNGLACSYSIQPDEAAALHRQLGEAVAKARLQGAADRH